MPHVESEIRHIEGGVMVGMRGYAQSLRAIGQALETLNIQDFDMEPEGDDFYVRGNVPIAANRDLPSDQCGVDELRAIWGDEFGDRQARSDLSVLSRIELCYTARDVERLEEEGRSRRGNSQKNADASSLSQILRCIGAYLNQKRARLCKISRESEFVALEYETSLGSPMRETLAVKDLYDLWVRMYLQRSERAQ